MKKTTKRYVKTNRNLAVHFGSSSLNVNLYAFYLGVRALSHKGSIHNYQKLIPVLSERLGICKSTFYSYLNICKDKGWMAKDSTKKNLLIYNPKKLFSEQVNIKTKATTSSTHLKMKEVKTWLQGYVIYYKSCQMNYNARKKRINTKNYCTITRTDNSGNEFKEQVGVSESCISHRTIAKMLGYKTAGSSFNAQKRMKGIGAVLKTEQRSKFIKQCSFDTYCRMLAFADEPGHYFYKDGCIYKQLQNRITMSCEAFSFYPKVTFTGTSGIPEMTVKVEKELLKNYTQVEWEAIGVYF